MPTLLSIQPVAEQGGSDTALVAMLASLSRDGWTCHVALPAASPLAAQYARAGAQLHVVDMRRLTGSGGPGYWAGYALRWPGSVLRLARLARHVRADVVHSNSLHSWYGWAVAALVRRPHAWHAREIVAQSGAALRVERLLARRAALVIAVSRAVAAQLDPRNVRVLLDEPSLERFSPLAAGRTRRAAGLADDQPLVGAVGRIDTWKGLDVLLDAVPLIRAGCPQLQVLVAGPDVAGKQAYADGLRARAETLGVHWLGPRSDTPELMADLDVFVLASTLPEPFGLVLVEALACGVAVVATDAGGPPEILATVPPAAGRLVPPADPAALAAAVLALLPAVTGTALRQARPRLRQEPAVRWAEVFAPLLRP